MHAIFTHLRDEFGAQVAGLDAAQTQLQPDGRPEAWSIQQIAEHLMLSYASTAKTMQARLEKGTATKATATVANRFGQFAITTAGYFPKGRIAPEIVAPGQSQEALDGWQIGDAFAASLTAMDTRMEEVERLLGRGRCVSHVILGPMSIANWRRFHLAHGRHHLKQIARIRETHGAAGTRGTVDGQA